VSTVSELVRAVLRAVAWCAAIALPAPHGHAQTFANPIFKSQDPWVLAWHGAYYYSQSLGRTITIRTAPTLTGLANAPDIAVWNAPNTGPNSQNVWAPEIHFLNRSWYIYYSADDGNGANHRLFVLQSTTGKPIGPYRPARTGYHNGELYEPNDSWAIDPDVFTASDGHNYIVWSGEAGSDVQNLYLAALSDPLHIMGSRVLISQPTLPWETRTRPIEEGPVGYTRNGTTYITYSASASWTTDYTVGLLTNVTGTILDPGSWVKSGPILDHHDTAYGPGSVVFTPSPDGTETWMLYHGIDSQSCTPSYTCRDIRMQKITWNLDGSPLLGYPVDPGVPLRLPSGENGPYGWGAAWSGDPVTGIWTYSGATGAQSASDGTSWHAVFRGDPGLYDYTVSAQILWQATASGDGTPRYGIYAYYKDSADHVEAFIDRANHQLSTHAVVGGADMGWQNSPLRANFNAAKFHTLAVNKADAVFTFLLDGVRMQQRSFAVGNGQIGLVTDGTQAKYQSVSVVDNSCGWGDAFGDAAEGQTALGLRTGSWNVQTLLDVNAQGLGAGWDQIFRGNPNPADYTLSADLQWLQTGTTSAFPKYGLYAAYQDANNHVEVFLDRNDGVLATHAVVGGVDAGWQNTNLPTGFDPTQYHVVQVVKTGSLFTFLLDGTQTRRRTTAMSPSPSHRESWGSQGSVGPIARAMLHPCSGSGFAPNRATMEQTGWVQSDTRSAGNGSGVGDSVPRTDSPQRSSARCRVSATGPCGDTP
jgi:GH43 family beta-xylosidase